jgi:hypothetical protein
VVQADVHLVVAVMDHAYVAIDKGPINDTHALVVAVEHYPNMVTLKPEALADVEAIMGTLRAVYASKGLQLVGFERYDRQHSYCSQAQGPLWLLRDRAMQAEKATIVLSMPGMRKRQCRAAGV